LLFLHRKVPLGAAALHNWASAPMCPACVRSIFDDRTEENPMGQSAAFLTSLFSVGLISQAMAARQ